MIGLDIIYYCPICGKHYARNISVTNYYTYKNKTLAMLECYKCNNTILAETTNAPTSYLGINNNDKQAIKIAGVIHNYIKTVGYTNETPEDQLEADLLAYLTSTFGDAYITRYEYETKSIIQKCISNLFNVPVTILESYVFTEDIAKEAKYSHTTAW